MKNSTSNKILIGSGVLLALVALYMLLAPVKSDQSNSVVVTEALREEAQMSPAEPNVIPIEHASFILEWGDEVVYFDPVGELADYERYPRPTMIMITDIHGDHFNKDIIGALLADGIDLITPVVVRDALPTDVASRATVMANDETITVRDFTITAVPMYNLPGEREQFHKKGQGNGYLLEREGVRVYNAGDTAGTPEMKAMQDIDIAFVPMNLPFTMDINEAAEAVLAFAPKVVYPFHYRGREGMSDVEEFKRIVTEANPAIEVVLADWYKAAPDAE
jgi:L-ascorbate metabolism protein UlaG (beta-lactamase superfamily)